MTKAFKTQAVALVKALQKELDEEVTSNDITIAVNSEEQLKNADFTWQSGDNSFAGPCYYRQYWGIASFTADCDPNDVAEMLYDDCLELIPLDDD